MSEMLPEFIRPNLEYPITADALVRKEPDEEEEDEGEEDDEEDDEEDEDDGNDGNHDGYSE
jgi:hypothetical protein